jgi:hypothetical protein
MFCQWCGKARDPDSIAIHHCGSKDRPAAFCIGCGAALTAGNVDCASCGTPAGHAPVRVATVAATSPSSDEPSSRLSGGPMPSAPPRASVAVRPTSQSNFLRNGQLVSALVGTLAFFIPWTAFGSAGIYDVIQSSWKWWNPPSPQIVFGLMLIALVLSMLGRRADGSLVSAVVALVGLLLVACLADTMWDARHLFSDLTGFYVVVAAGVLVFVFAAASTLRDQ